MEKMVAIALFFVFLVCGCAPAPVPAAPAAPTPALLEQTPKAAVTPVPATATPATATPVPATSAPEPTPTPPALPLAGRVIGLDPGHQARADRGLEPVAPGSERTKHKVASGTRGIVTRVYEHEVNLAVGLRLRDLLEAEGAGVVMTRETGEVSISNKERAELFNAEKVDLAVRLHCNGSGDQSRRGAFMLVPKDKAHPFYRENVRAAKAILEAYGEATGLDAAKGITYRADQTGFNWCERPVVNIEMGHLTNPEEDRLLTDPEFQDRMAAGICAGVLRYFQEVLRTGPGP